MGDGEGEQPRKRPKKAQDRKRRRRLAKRQEAGGIYYQLNPALRSKFDAVLKVKLDVKIGDEIKACKGSFQGLHRTREGVADTRSSPTLPQLIEIGTSIFPWDGRSVFSMIFGFLLAHVFPVSLQFLSTERIESSSSLYQRQLKTLRLRPLLLLLLLLPLVAAVVVVLLLLLLPLQ